MHSVPL